jgi:shikimate kinase
MTVRRILLVGFMGAGKSAVGRALATELGWRFRDFDEAISARVGLTIPRIFEEYGERAFRSLEARVGSELLGMESVVLASGGGWPCREGRLDLSDETLSIWLRVTPEVAVERCGDDRPLLGTVEEARELLEARLPYYEKARWSVDSTTGSPEELAARIADEIRRNPERPLQL